MPGGYDYTKSLLDAGGGTIRPMSGGGEGVPPTSTYNAGASLIQNVPGPIPAYKGGFLDGEGIVLSGGEGNPGTKSTIGQERVATALKRISDMPSTAADSVSIPTISSKPVTSELRAKITLSDEPNESESNVKINKTETETKIEAETENMKKEQSQESAKSKDIILFGESITLDNPEKDSEPFTESQIKSLKAFGLDGPGVNDTQKRDILKALYEGKCNTSQPLIMLEQCEPIRRIVQSLALNLLSKLGTNGKSSLNITKEEEPEVKYEKLGDGSMKLSILFKPGQLGLLSKFKPEAEKKPINKGKLNNKGGPANTNATATVEKKDEEGVAPVVEEKKDEEGVGAANTTINESKLNEELEKLILEMEKLEKNEISDGISKNNSIKQLTANITTLKSTIEKLSKNIEGFSELIKDKPELSEKINKLREFKKHLKGNSFKDIPDDIKNPLNEELEDIFDYLKNNNSVAHSEESVVSKESNLSPEIIEFNHEIEKIKNKESSLNNSSIVEIIHKIVNNPQNSRLSKINIQHINEELDETMKYLNSLPPNVSDAEAEKAKEIKNALQQLNTYINSESAPSHKPVSNESEYKNCSFTAEQLNEKFKITGEVKDDKDNKFDIMEIKNDGWCLYMSALRSLKGKFTSGGSAYSDLPKVINDVSKYLIDNINTLSSVYKEGKNSVFATSNNTLKLTYQTQLINGERQTVETLEEYSKFLITPRENINITIPSDAIVKCKTISNDKIKEYFEFTENDIIQHISIDEGPLLWPDLNIIGDALSSALNNTIFVFNKDESTGNIKIINKYKAKNIPENNKGIYLLYTDNHYNALIPMFEEMPKSLKENKKNENAKVAEPRPVSPLISNNQEEFLSRFNLPPPTGNVLAEIKTKKEENEAKKQKNEEKIQENQKKNNKLMNTMIKKRQNETKQELKGIKNTMKFLGNRETARKSFLNPANKNKNTMNKMTKKRQNEIKKELENIKQYKKVSGENEKKTMLSPVKGGKRKTFKKTNLKRKRVSMKKQKNNINIKNI